MNKLHLPLVAACFLLAAAIAYAQPGPTDPAPQPETSDQPMSLTAVEDPPADSSSTSTTTTTTTDSGGFWFWPSPAPTRGPIATDRPGFSDTASLVERGHLQLETGYQYSYNRENRRRAIDHTFPQLALRTGLTDWLEFRTSWAGYSLTENLGRVKTLAGRHVNHETHDDSGTDLTLGFKVPLLREQEGKPNISLITSLTVPTGGSTKSANNVVPEVKFPWNYAITKEWGVYGSMLMRVNDGRGGQFFQTGATLATAYQVHEKVKLYIEYFGLYPDVRSEDCSHLLSAGPIIALTDNISLDMRASVGLNEQAPDFQTSVGLGFRF